MEDDITHIRVHLDHAEEEAGYRESTLPKSMHGVVGMSESLVEVYRIVDRVADTTCTSSSPVTAARAKELAAPCIALVNEPRRLSSP